MLCTGDWPLLEEQAQLIGKGNETGTAGEEKLAVWQRRNFR